MESEDLYLREEGLEFILFYLHTTKYYLYALYIYRYG